MSTKIFFDESYDQPAKEFTVLGALYAESGSALHTELSRAKKRHGFTFPDGRPRELKYVDCIDQTCFKVARDVVDAFASDLASRFKCIVIEKRLVDRRRFGRPHEPDKIIDARIYKKFAELLLRNSLGGTTGAVLLADNVTRCQGDRFLELLKEIFSTPDEFHSQGKKKPAIKHVQEVPSHVKSYQALQICDLLCGCVLNENMPAKSKRSGKNKIRRRLCARLGVADLSRDLWKPYGGVPAPTKEKFDVWYWQPQ